MRIVDARFADNFCSIIFNVFIEFCSDFIEDDEGDAKNPMEAAAAMKDAIATGNVADLGTASAKKLVGGLGGFVGKGLGKGLSFF